MKLFSLPKSAPKEGMFIECGKMPIRFMIIMRRIMFYWSVLHRDEKELLNKFLTVQQLSLLKMTGFNNQERTFMTSN